MDDRQIEAARGRDVRVRVLDRGRDADHVGLRSDAGAVLRGDAAAERRERLSYRGSIVAQIKAIRTRDPDTLKAKVLRQSAHPTPIDTDKMDREAWPFEDLQRRRYNKDERADRRSLEQPNDVAIPHADATMRQRPTDQILSARAVDIDIPVVRVDPRSFVDTGLKTFEPQDARQDQIVFRRSAVPVLTRIFSISEDAPERRAVAIFLINAMDAGRRLERVLRAAVAEAGRGTVVSLDDGLRRTDEERLGLDRHNDIALVRAAQMGTKGCMYGMQYRRFHGRPLYRVWSRASRAWRMDMEGGMKLRRLKIRLIK